MESRDAKQLALYLTGRFGLSLTATHRRDDEGETIDLQPTDVNSHAAFLFRIRIGWRSLGVELVFGPFAGDLVRAMGQSDDASRAAFAALAHAVVDDRGTVQMIVNGSTLDPERPDTWPTEWAQLAITVQSPQIDPDSAGPLWGFSVGQHWAGRLLAMTLALLSTMVEETDEVALDATGLPEGGKARVEVNRYERSRANRALCVEVHGLRCHICDFDFGETYGELGEGFIHVHHLVPVSSMGNGYRVNPVTDLVPVCPNCHAMLHRHDPPLSITALREQLVRNTGTRNLVS